MENTDIKSGEIKTYYRGGDSISTNSRQARTPLMIQFLQWYNHWFFQCASKSGEFATDFYLIINQHSSPFLLFKPKTLLTVFYTALMNFFKTCKQPTI